MFAEVILPLPLYSTFTYSIPAEMAGNVERGSRVLVQFGKRRFYTGLVESTHDRAPEGYEVKPISCILDPEPVIRYPQLKFWEWISSYYLCSLGEVYKAAVPTGLKPESTTYLSLNPDYELQELEGNLTENEAMVLQAIGAGKRSTLADIGKDSAVKNVTAVVKRLIETGVVEVSEKVVDKYRPKTEKMVRLGCNPKDNDALHALFGMTTRSAKQEKALVSYLDLSGALAPSGETKEVTRTELIEKSRITPGILKAMVDKGIFEIYKKSFNRFEHLKGKVEPLASLSDAQQKAYREISDSFRENNVVLLHGVTGSGKTEIYQHLIKRVLDEGKQVLFLVPEISLTTQLTDRLHNVFADKMLVYHSRFSDSERVDVWNRLLHSNEPLLIVGVRSSVFLPFGHLGLVIVDEEHESSYKQYDPAPRYNARDSAIMLAAMHGAKTLLGSATPAIDTYWKAQSSKYGLVELTERFEGAKLPEVTVVDMRDQRKRKSVRGILSEPLRLATEEELRKGNQAIMFQNRRGFAPFVVCRNCGWSPKCINCDVSLVYHKHNNVLRCHYCGHSAQLPALCPACGENSIEVCGYGTERIAEDVHGQFPDYTVKRMDLDTTRSKDAYQDIIEDFANHDTDILVGTQMISKGLDFGKVTAVGVLNADSILNFPDFRANERAFNMLEQVAGRAGRRGDAGRVFIQCSDPERDLLAHVCRHDYKAFYKEEIEARRRLVYPPFSRIINIYFKNKDPKDVDRAAAIFAGALRHTFGQRVLGPQKPFVSRIATYYLQCIMLKVEATASMQKVKQILRTVYESLARDPRIKSSIIYYDVDPG